MPVRDIEQKRLSKTSVGRREYDAFREPVRHDLEVALCAQPPLNQGIRGAFLNLNPCDILSAVAPHQKHARARREFRHWLVRVDLAVPCVTA